jgi:hypothetical protein
MSDDRLAFVTLGPVPDGITIGGAVAELAEGPGGLVTAEIRIPAPPPEPSPDPLPGQDQLWPDPDWTEGQGWRILGPDGGLVDSGPPIQLEEHFGWLDDDEG